MIDISIITINYNSSNETISMIESLNQKSSKDLNIEIIVVDNNSNKDEKKIFLEKSKDLNITYIQSNLNTGFAGGNMLGMQKATGKYLFFLNNDTIILNDVNKILFEYMETNKDIGITTAQLYDENQKFTPSFHHFPTPLIKLFGNSAGRFFYPNKYPKQQINYSLPIEVDVVSGSCMFVRSDVFKKIGGFDTTFFLYCEEEDLSKRVRDYGYKVTLNPIANVVHKSGKSTIRNILIEKEFVISYFYLLDKHYGNICSCLMKTIFILKLFKRSIKDKSNFAIFILALKGAKLKNSLRHIQIIQ